MAVISGWSPTPEWLEAGSVLRWLGDEKRDGRRRIGSSDPILSARFRRHQGDVERQETGELKRGQSGSAEPDRRPTGDPAALFGSREGAPHAPQSAAVSLWSYILPGRVCHLTAATTGNSCSGLRRTGMAAGAALGRRCGAWRPRF
jgi:hypothetical protein